MHERSANDPASKPLAAIFLRKLVGVYLLLGVLIFGIQLIAEYRSHRQQLMESLQSLATTFAPGAASAMWNFQEGSLASMVSGIGLQSDVVSVEIKGVRSEQDFSWTSPDGAVASSTLRVAVPLTLVDDGGKLQTVGTLTVTSNNDRLWKRLNGVVISIFEVGFALMLVSGVVVWRLVNSLVVKPLSRFSDQVIARGTSTQLAIALDGSQVSEIATLLAGFNRLMHQVGQDKERIHDHNVNLERKVSERTQDLEAANKAKSEFLARMSHEIRTPMNAVIGLTQLTLRSELAPLQRDYLGKVLGSAKALLGIINDILDFSKIEAGKLTLEEIELNLQDVLDDAFTVLSLSADEKGLSLRQQLAPDVPTRLRGDALRLGQVLLNLVGNAIKFTPRGAVSVSVTLAAPANPAEPADQRARLRFCVEDTGVGLSDEQVASLFQSFHQADGSVTRRFGGTGLGLAITKQLVELMHGQVWVESTLGLGSRFYFEVELGVCSGAPQRQDRRLSEAEDTHARRKTDSIVGAPVLLVEDNPINQLVARNFLEINGVVVDMANDGAQGVAMALTGKYALVLMDIQMPVMDGLTAARTIRATPGFERLPIVAITANAMVADYQNSMDAGMNDHITKPIDPQQLTATLLRWIVVPAGGFVAGNESARALPDPLAAHRGPDPLLPALPLSAHLDTQRGLLQVGGSVPLYISLLKSFLASHANEVVAIKQALATGATVDARRIAHTLKGTAATLGAQPLSANAAALEVLIRTTASASPQAIDAVQRELHALCADLARFFEATKVEVVAVLRHATQADRDVLLQGLPALMALLTRANLNAIDVGAQLGKQLENTVWSTDLERIQTDINSMHFDAALVRARALLAGL